MNILKDVLKECNIHYDGVPGELLIKNTSIDNNVGMYDGLVIHFASLCLKAHHTYLHDFISIELSFINNIDYIDATELATYIAQHFRVLNPPQLNVKEVDGHKKPCTMQFVIQCDKKYNILVLLVYVMRFPVSCYEHGLL